MSLRAGRQEADTINVPQAVVGFVSAITLIIGTFFGVLYYTKNDSTARPGVDLQTPLKPGEAPQFGMLHQTMFETVSDARELKKVQAEQLESYGWVDQGKGIAHIPIEKAKQLIVEGKAK